MKRTPKIATPNDPQPLLSDTTIKAVLGALAALGMVGNGLQAYTRPPEPVPSVPLAEYNEWIRQSNAAMVALGIENAKLQAQLDACHNKPCKKRK